MNSIYEIAYAAVNKRLCLFTGTGFSKSLTNNEAPGWQALLEQACDNLGDLENIKESLFPNDKKNPLSLEESAQVIYIEYLKKEKDLHTELAKIISEISPAENIDSIKEFLKNGNVKIVTTNYDKLIEKIIPAQDCQSLAPGLPIPKSQARIKIYHVHGSIDSPTNMVVTSDDYFKFINHDSYFSKKLSSIIYENTVVILGYSLGDTNLKAIINEYKAFARENVIGSSMFLISKNSVENYLKEYYFHCYGIRVIDKKEIIDFFSELNVKISEVDKKAESSLENIRNVIFNNHYFTKDYLKVESNFYEVIVSLSAIGVLITNERALSMIEKIISDKIELTQENGAWEQYVQMANWLIYLSTILEIKSTSLESIFIKAVTHSMNNMSKELKLGYSWHAYQAWESKWPSIIVSNRMMIKKHANKHISSADARNIVNSL